MGESVGAVSLLPEPPPLYNIVVLGAMNPRIHHPLWYRLIECISEAEEREAANGKMVLMPQIAIFSAAGLTINCQEERWEVSTQDESLCPRILKVASTVFAKLYETPVRAYGFNTMLHLETMSPNVSKEIGMLGAATGLGFPESEISDCDLTFVRRDALKSNTVSIGASAFSANRVFVRYNSNFDLKGSGEYFNLANLLQYHFGAHLRAAQEFSRNIVSRLSKVAGN